MDHQYFWVSQKKVSKWFLFIWGQFEVMISTWQVMCYHAQEPVHWAFLLCWKTVNVFWTAGKPVREFKSGSTYSKCTTEAFPKISSLWLLQGRCGIHLINPVTTASWGAACLLPELPCVVNLASADRVHVIWWQGAWDHLIKYSSRQWAQWIAHYTGHMTSPCSLVGDLSRE